jgi:hypothetical protein
VPILVHKGDFILKSLDGKSLIIVNSTSSPLLNTSAFNKTIGKVANSTLVLNDTVLEVNSTSSVMKAINPSLGDIVIINPGPAVDVCQNFSNRPRPTLTIDPHLSVPARTMETPFGTLFVENHPMYLFFTLKNNGDVPISGKILGGINQYQVVNLLPGQILSDTIKARAPTAGKEMAIQLTYYDDCAPSSSEFGQVPTGIGVIYKDIAARYRVILNNFHVTQTRAHNFDTNVVGFEVESGDQKFPHEGYFAGNVPANTWVHMNLKSHPLYIIPEDLSFLRFSYAIVNAGHATDDASKFLSKASKAAIGIAGGATGAALGGPVGAIAGAAIGAIAEAFGELLEGSCDGGVAANWYNIPSFKLQEWTLRYGSQPASFRYTDYFNDQPSAGFLCGTPKYDVTWTIERNTIPQAYIRGDSDIRVGQGPGSITVEYSLETQDMLPPLKEIVWRGDASINHPDGNLEKATVTFHFPRLNPQQGEFDSVIKETRVTYQCYSSR